MWKRLVFALFVLLACASCSDDPPSRNSDDARTSSSPEAPRSVAAQRAPGRPADRDEQIGSWQVASWLEEGKEVRIVGVLSRDPLIIAGGCEDGETTFNILDSDSGAVQNDKGTKAVRQWRSMNKDEVPGTAELAERVAAACEWRLEPLDPPPTPAASSEATVETVESRRQVGDWLTKTTTKDGIVVSVTLVGGQHPRIILGGCENGVTSYQAMVDWNVSESSGGPAIEKWRLEVANAGISKQTQGAREAVNLIADACGWTLH